jgi:xanthine dehydrogenase YagS FAD-binding subunit
MRPFEFERATDLAGACRLGSGTGQGQTNSSTQFLAGGTTLVDLMKLDVLRPDKLVYLGALQTDAGAVKSEAGGLTLGAFASMAAVAAHPQVIAEYPAIAQSLQLYRRPAVPTTATQPGNPATNAHPAAAVRHSSRSIAITPSWA